MTQPFPDGLTAPQEWMDGLIPKAPGAAADMIKHEVLTTLRDFFQRSGAWRDWIAPIRLQPGEVLYSPELTDVKAEICFILNGYLGEEKTLLSPAPPGMAMAQIYRTDVGVPNYYYLTPERRFCIFPAPDGTVEYEANLFVSMKPLDLCVPTWIVSRFYDDICNGVLSRLYKVPGPNFKPNDARDMARAYMAAVNRATVEAMNGNTALNNRAPYNKFGQGFQRRGRRGSSLWGYNG